jgi:ABC-type nitrate/sulfonate/bicarbonate transport system substrate-binding protein
MAGANWLYRAVRKSYLTTKVTKVTKVTKDTKVSDNYYSELRALRDLRGENFFPFLRGRAVLAVFVVASLLLMQTSAPESFAAAGIIRIGYPQPSGAMLPIWVMAETKLDQKYGVDLQNIYIAGGARLTQTLVSGDIELAATGGAVVNAVLSGAELVYVAASVPTYGFSLYARSDVKDVPSLKGKVVGLMTKGASTDHGLTALLRQYNLRSGLDVKVLYLGGVREGLAALDRGIVSATTISAPTTLMARRMGYKELVNFTNLKIPYIQLGIVAHRSFLRQQPERMKAFLKGYVAAIKVVNEDSDTSKRALAKYLATSDGAILEEAYQAYRGIYPKVPYTTEEQVRSILSVADHPKAAGADPKDFFDNRFIKELEDTGFIKELYGQR